MEDREKRALGALASMVRQYVYQHHDGVIDSGAMSAAEHAIGALSEYGYMDETCEGRIMGRWTEAGEALLEWNYPFSEQKNKTFPMPPIINPVP
ncbi:hypothetical protein [Methylovirgula sp. 4M-Z18]|uniref:hypothetical protein n=1 Tax=Methylovirgula sp. 4M-Z18 TaxID=2293567 RepID=UPI000E2F17F8|nr:hypothetical protein [Methylovirgula sp. 4M-Z18]RFB79047.1 hypothetical protein DYH55_14625 [Methylovirgula sp. 4M-Z18]